MKKIKVEIKESTLNKKLGSEFNLFVHDKANVLYVLDKIDWLLIRKLGKFPLSEFKSLLHMIYDPTRKRFYEQVILHASSPKSLFIPVRNNPELELEDGTSIRLILLSVCADAPEPVLKYEEFYQVLFEDPHIKNYLKTNAFLSKSSR
jgi:hypothetical protein